MATFSYNNAKNISISYISFQVNCGYHLYALYDVNIKLYYKSKSIYKLANEPTKLMTVYRENFLHSQDLSRSDYNKIKKA